MKNLSALGSLTNVHRRVVASAFTLAALAAPAVSNAAESYSGWSWNFTPVLVMPRSDEDLGGGVDPEVQYTLDQGGARLSAGLRIGGYYARNLFGVTTMPTLRLTVPVGPVEPYASFGMGYGWLPEVKQEGVASMSRLGVIFRFSDSFALGVEGTLQNIQNTEFRFPSIGSMISFDL